MNWINSDGYVRYNVAVGTVKRILGLGAVDFYMESEELTPYITFTLEYISKRLILLGDNKELKDLVQEVLDIYNYGAEKIISLESTELAEEIGIRVTQEETDEVEYETERFVFTWTNVLTSIVVRLRFLYPFLFADVYDGECCKCGVRGENTTTYEAWRSGVYPEDEMYDRTIYYNNNTSWGTLKPKDVDCRCLREGE